ncbi:MAG TPA: type 2 lanthipeptide synthetase LanM family protein [Xanthobacteraceae bacterium]|jgi:type 2 lantibiotic biosynthesis protein LanM
MDTFHDRLIFRTATIDELLSGDFEPVRGQKGDTDLAARRLAAWCRSCASGDWSLFSRRLNRDGLAIDAVLARFATVRRSPSTPLPTWIDDAVWIENALQTPRENAGVNGGFGHNEPCAFEHLFGPLVDEAEALLASALDARVFANVSELARASLRFSLLKELTDLCAPALYERFAKARTISESRPDAAQQRSDAGTSCYDQFIAEMRAGGFRRFFEDKPVLLRLIASITRQWIDTSREFLVHLDADLPTIRRDLQARAAGLVQRIEGGLSDRHNGGRSTQIVSFEDGSRVVYKPKDLRVDAAWCDLVERLNRANPALQLKAVRAVALHGYGWTEFIDHAGCADQQDCKLFFRRAGAWLALFHLFAATDMHQENIIAAGDHPVPIDLEMVLQGTAEEHKAQDPEQQAVEAARETLTHSVMMVGLLPAYGRGPNNDVFAIGGMTESWDLNAPKWDNINSDAMRPTKLRHTRKANPNLPHVNGQYAKFADHVDDFVAGFSDYAEFLLRESKDPRQGGLLRGFAGLPVRKVIRPTRFYAMLLQRLQNHRTMDDGVVWSAQADFLARLANWDTDTDPLWCLQRAERSALLTLNVPHFTTLSNGTEIRDAAGTAIHSNSTSGMDNARARIDGFDAQDIAWQIEVIRQNTSSISRPTEPAAAGSETGEPLRSSALVAQSSEIFVAEADRIAGELCRCAIRRGSGAAWIGLDWLGDAEVFQLACLGPDLYNGASGIALFLAAHAAVTRSRSSGELAVAGISHLRKNLNSRNAARTARSLGIGGAAGLGSIVYALTAMSQCLKNGDLLADAHVAAELFTDELIAADTQLDVIGGSAGAILSLLRLYRDTQSEDVLRRAIKCGEHLLSWRRLGSEGHRSWIGQGFGPRALNGMSHGAAGFAYALASLSAACGRDEFAQAAAECITFENSSYDAERKNWPDFRGESGPSWACRWCHGAPGIGLARLATAKRGGMDPRPLETDALNAVDGARRCWPGQLDTLCCGTLGSVELFCEAGRSLDRHDLRDLAAQCLLAVLQRAASTGDYRWNSGKEQFNLGLFRGLAGVGYTLLRQVDASLPNVLIWE